MSDTDRSGFTGARHLLLLGKELIEPPMRDARWFIYLVRTEAGVLEIRSMKKLTGIELRRRAVLRLNAKAKRKPKKK